MLFPLEGKIGWNLFLTFISIVILYPNINCHQFKSDTCTVLKTFGIMNNENTWMLSKISLYFCDITNTVIFSTTSKCFHYDESPVVEILRIPSDESVNDDLVAFRYSLKHGKPSPNKKQNTLPEKVSDDDVQLEYSYKCPPQNKTKGDRHLAQLVAVIYRKLDTSDKERTVTFYLPGPATVPVFREPITDCTSPRLKTTPYVYKGCGGE